MNDTVPRTCTEILPQKQGNRKPRPLEEFRSAAAYVLLGDPGSGKTTAFEAERNALAESAHLISARDFLALDMDSHPEWRDKTLYIDGLDEIRAGATHAITPFEKVRRRLDRLGRPRFRLSCREADWLGDNDREHLAAVSRDAQVTILRLDPLTDSDVFRILNDCPGIDDAQAFVKSAREWGVEALLKNPMSLKMLSEAVAQDKGWPNSRSETFEKACLKIAQEHNRNHEIAGQLQSHTPDQLIDAAGRLCAVHLLAGTAGYSRSNSDADGDYPTPDTCTRASPEVLRRALSTKLFQSASHHRLVPVHRHIAEFLGARHLAKTVEEGLPARRVLASDDRRRRHGGHRDERTVGLAGSPLPTSPLRPDRAGPHRGRLVRRYPPVLTDEKQALLKALRREREPACPRVIDSRALCCTRHPRHGTGAERGPGQPLPES